MSSCTFSSLLLLTVLFFRYSAFGENSGNFTLKKQLKLFSCFAKRKSVFMFMNYVHTKHVIDQPAWKPRVRWIHRVDSVLRSGKIPLGLCSLASWSSRQSRGSRTCDVVLLGIGRSACLPGVGHRWYTSAWGCSVSLQPLRWCVIGSCMMILLQQWCLVMRKGAEKKMLHREDEGVVGRILNTWSWDFDSVFANLAGGGDLATGGSSRQPWVWRGSL